MKKQYKKIKGVKYIFVDEPFYGRWERYYTEAQMKKEIKKNQDICFHEDGWLISRTAGH